MIYRCVVLALCIVQAATFGVAKHMASPEVAEEALSLGTETVPSEELRQVCASSCGKCDECWETVPSEELRQVCVSSCGKCDECWTGKFSDDFSDEKHSDTKSASATTGPTAPKK